MVLQFLYLLRKNRYLKKKKYNSLISFENSKPPNNDKLTTGFYCNFWDDIKDTSMNFLKEI